MASRRSSRKKIFQAEDDPPVPTSTILKLKLPARNRHEPTTSESTAVANLQDRSSAVDNSDNAPTILSTSYESCNQDDKPIIASTLLLDDEVADEIAEESDEKLEVQPLRVLSQSPSPTPAPKRKQGPGKVKTKSDLAETPESQENDQKLKRVVLFVPQSNGGGDKRVTLSTSISYESALDVIYKTIGCSEITRKPDLSYKLKDTPRNVAPIGLQAEEDWDGLREDVLEHQKKKKTPIPVHISVSEQYMKSLQARNKSKKMASQGSDSKGRRKGKPVPLLDLDADDDEDDDEAGDDSIVEREKNFSEQLQKSLCRCQLCGPTKYCIISKAGVHTNLTHQQRRGWIVALAIGTAGVTLQTPPRSDLFAEFHSNKQPTTTAPPATPTAAPPVQMLMPGMPNASMNPFMMIPPWYMSPQAFQNPSFAFQGVPAAPSTPVASNSRAEKHDLLSSPPDGTFQHPYTSIDEFLNRLAAENPKRKLDSFIEQFECLDYYKVDEIADINLDRLIVAPFSMTPGNADFLLKAVKAEVKRVDRIREKDRVQAKRARLQF